MLKKKRINSLFEYDEQKREGIRKESDVSVRMNVRRHLTSIR